MRHKSLLACPERFCTRLLHLQTLHDVSPTPPRTFISTITTPETHVKTSFMFVGGMLFAIFILVVVALIWRYFQPKALQKMMKSTSGLPDKNFSTVNLRTISYFDYRTLKKATGDFHPTNHIGKGGFGPVHKGMLDDGTMIAVKQLCIGKSQGEVEFLSEVKLITNIQHKNLVRLIGCCSERTERLLVYEYMKNGSLDCLIYGNSEVFLSWQTRFQIILGIARGLQYLHEESNIRIVHRDIKASNILLDDRFQPKISDFGLARFFPEDQSYLSTTVAGTLGYTAPEYAIKGELSEKADIYSFGVLALEIISCRKNTDYTLPEEMQYLPEYAWKLYERSKVIDMVDPKLQEEGFAEQEVLKVCQVALVCLQPHPSLRPAMSEVVSMLTCRAGLNVNPVKPTYLGRNREVDGSPSWDSVSAVQSPPLRSESFSTSRAEMHPLSSK